MILDRIPILRSIFGSNDRAAAEVSRRWRRAFTAEPDLAEDVIRLGGLLVAQPVDMVDGYPQPAPIDPHRLAYEAGKRDLALLLLAQGGISYHELNQLMEANEP
ncbi:MAG: hypothetical protein AAF408_00125 [Pseudomonadota bacterium]